MDLLQAKDKLHLTIFLISAGQGAQKRCYFSTKFQFTHRPHNSHYYMERGTYEKSVTSLNPQQLDSNKHKEIMKIYYIIKGQIEQMQPDKILFQLQELLTQHKKVLHQPDSEIMSNMYLLGSVFHSSKQSSFTST